MTNTTRRTLVALATAAAALLTTTALAAPASADTFPCQYDASTPGVLVVLGGTHDHPGARVTITHHHRTIHARLDHTDRLIRTVPMHGWTDRSVHVWVSGERCETT